MTRVARKLRMARRTVRYHGARMRVRELRGDRKRTFVMVHGIGVSSDYFEPLAHALHEHGNVLLLDLPGFGGLPHPSAPLTISGFADIVRAGIEAEDIDNPVLIGHSMGAQVVVDLLSRHDISSHTVLIGPVVNPAEPRVRQQLWRFFQSAAHESWGVRLLASRAYLRCGPAWFLEVLPAMMRYPIREQLQHVRADILLITGEHDSVVPEDWVEAMLAQLPKARTERIAGAAHNVVYDHWRQVAELTLAHLGLTVEEPS